MRTALAAAPWLLLVTAMVGGEALMRLLVKGGILSPHKETWFRAGHAHAGTLLLMFLLYLDFIERTGFGGTARAVWSVTALVGVLGIPGGLFLHMGSGRPHHASAGIRITSGASVVLAGACIALVYGLVTA